MKPGLAILPLEVWADVSEHPLITREVLGRIADNNGDPDFTNKLQKLLHGCGKQTLRYLLINTKDKSKPECQASLKVASDIKGTFDGSEKDCEFPETEMPDNIKTFKRLSICFLDDQVLDFLEKIKSLFTNVDLEMWTTKTEDTFLAHFLPMLTSIHGIRFSYDVDLNSFEQRFPGTLALAKELHLLLFYTQSASILALLDWLVAPQDLDVDGPRFLTVCTTLKIDPIVDAVRKQFLAATTQSAFVIFLKFIPDRPFRPGELTFENAATKEQLTLRDASYKRLKEAKIGINYVEIVCHPTGAKAKMRDWINGRAYYQTTYTGTGGAKRSKWIQIWQPTIGRITKKAKALDKVQNEAANGDEHGAGPSTSAVEK